MSVKVIPVRMVPIAPTASTATPAPAHLASVALTVRSTPTIALTGSSLWLSLASAYHSGLTEFNCDFNRL